MRRASLPALAGVLVAVLWPHARGADDPAVLTKGNTAFALELYGRLARQPGNLSLSPFSISTALALTYAGARGDTEREMAATLHFPVGGPELHRAVAGLARRLEEQCGRGESELAIANALWVQQGRRFLEPFLDISREHYGAGAHELDFDADTEVARQTINSWVSDQTRTRIPEVLLRGDLTRVTELVLTNAVYFRGRWATRFDARTTSQQPFWLIGGSVTQARMMKQAGRFAHAALDGLSLLELPYAGSDLAMDILLPDDVEGLAALEGRLSPGRLESWLSSLREREVSVAIPRFRVNARRDLVEPLVAMGMPSAFGPQADFSGMTAEARLFISKVVHEAFVQVDEEGSEAAAATAVVMERTGAVAGPVRFEADHPFMFLIRDRGTGSVVFMGRVVDPN